MPQNIVFLLQQYEDEKRTHQTSLIHVVIADAESDGTGERGGCEHESSERNLRVFEEIIRALTGSIKPIISAVQIQRLYQKVEL